MNLFKIIPGYPRTQQSIASKRRMLRRISLFAIVAAGIGVALEMFLTPGLGAAVVVILMLMLAAIGSVGILISHFASDRIIELAMM